MQNIYIILNFVSLIIISLLGAISYKNKDEKCSKYFMCSMIFMMIWTLGTILELSTKTFQFKIFFRNIIQVGMAFVSISNYWFVISYTESDNKFYRGILRIFIILNIFAVALLFTDPIHHLMRSKVLMIQLNGRFDLLVTSTKLGTFFVLIRFVLFGFATILLFIYLAKTFKSMRKQVSMISMGYLIALILLVVKQYLLEEHGFSVPMSVIMCIPYIFIGVGVFRYDFLSISPLAKDWVINSLEEGIVVFSKDGNVLELNTAASIFLENYGHMLDKNKLSDIWKSVRDSVHHLEFDTESRTDYYEVKIHHLLMKNGRKKGAVAVIRNTTVEMLKQFELKEKAELDGLTKIFNRKTLEKKYEAIKNGPVSVMITDIDKFKKINDTYGHPVGDVVIIGVVEAMKKCICSNDLIGRLGGDEFCIILTECTKERCEDISNRIFNEIKYQRYNFDFEIPDIGISLGAFTNMEIGDMTFEDAYRHADLVLYEAKQRGGNCAVIK
jgi:diguanylate cyclase (GGDEF)-like protein